MVSCLIREERSGPRLRWQICGYSSRSSWGSLGSFSAHCACSGVLRTVVATTLVMVLPVVAASNFFACV